MERELSYTMDRFMVSGLDGNTSRPQRRGTPTPLFISLEVRVPGLSLPANVRLLGSRRIDELPAYLQNCDVAILPFVPGKISDAVSPIKIFEYLAMSKPVVATALPEISHYPNVFIARTVDEFADLCSRQDLRGSKAESFIMRNTWQCRAVDLVRPKVDWR